jgi:hypothetical protein
LFISFCIKGRVSSISPLRIYFSKNNEESVMFNFDFMDGTGEIKVVGFSNHHYEMFQKNGVNFKILNKNKIIQTIFLFKILGI